MFTASDFGRTLTSNGDGSDHGWGSHHFVIGGAVKGGELYGSFPRIALGTPEDIGQGRLLPTTAVDQYAATLASWYGVSASDLTTVLPNLGNFSVRRPRIPLRGPSSKGFFTARGGSLRASMSMNTLHPAPPRNRQIPMSVATRVPRSNRVSPGNPRGNG